MIDMGSRLNLLTLTVVGLITTAASASYLPTIDQMRSLDPALTTRLKAYDTLFRKAAAPGKEAQGRYSNASVLADLESRLQRAENSSDYLDVLTKEEQSRFSKNLLELKRLESAFFEKIGLALSMSVGVETQKLLTRQMSREPQGAKRQALIAFWKTNLAKNPLYSKWQTQASNTDLQWSEVIERFMVDREFRDQWIINHADTLPDLKQMMLIRAWDDTSVRTIHVFNAGKTDEYWVLEFDSADKSPNRFRQIISGDFDALVKIEFSPTVVFNRLARIQERDENGVRSIVYRLIPVKKGRTMEPASQFNESGNDKRLYPGAALLRSTKMDEFQQRELIQTDLSLFMGPRAISLYEAQMLTAKYPTLTKAVGQFGFSVTGGLAQTTSNRTDGVDKQATKFAATLIDIVEFANTDDVEAWFRRNTQQVLRTILGGVGAGGASGNFEPGRTSADSLKADREATQIKDCRAFSPVPKVLQKLIAR